MLRDRCQTSASEMAATGHFKPRLEHLLRSLRLDIAYDRAEGNTLFYTDAEGQRIEVLDLVGGYGSLLLGHGHPSLTATAIKFLTEKRPIHAQGSWRTLAAQLAGELSRRAGGEYYAVFANSGAEAVECALKHAMLQTGAKTFVALERGFHGKTLGALQVTSNDEYRDGLELPGLRVLRVPLNDVGALEMAFAKGDNLGGMIFEPVLGEGGVRPILPKFAQRAAELCHERQIPLIADECQTGLGRTGTFLACEQLGVRPDYVLLSKALGGGLAKISAVLIDRRQYLDEFDLKHTSTYADDDFSCGIALQTLALLDRETIARCANLGQSLLRGLCDLARRYPTVIAEVRGLGLMVGVQFQEIHSGSSMLLRFLSAQRDLLFVVAGYLLHAHRIRVAPTLSDRLTMRLEPSVLLTEDECCRLVAALEDVCQKLSQYDAAGLTAFLTAGSPQQGPAYVRTTGHYFAHEPERVALRIAAASVTRVAWLCHFVDADDLVSLEPGISGWSARERELLLRRCVAQAWPVDMGGTRIRSRTGQEVWLCPILLPFSSAWIKEQLETRRWAAAVQLVQHGVDLAHSLGCEAVSLGQYTSIVTGNGTRVRARGMGVTTGNSLALVLAMQAVRRAERDAGRCASDATLAVVGAGGNIGSAAAEVLAPSYRETLLIGRSRPASLRRLEELSRRIPRSRPAWTLAEVAAADTILVATNSVDTPLRADHFKNGSIVCDVSVPAALSSHVRTLRPDVLVINGGIAALPGAQDLNIVGFPLPPGQTYGCLAEGMLLGFENIRDMSFTGSLTARHLQRVAFLAQKHGFELTGYSTRPLLSPDRAQETCYALA